MLKLAVYTLLARLAIAPSDPETPAELQDRLMVIAGAVARSVDRATCYDHDYTCTQIWTESRAKLAAMEVTKAYSETRLALNIHAGNCGRYQCGPWLNPRTGEVEHLSLTLWQLEKPPTMSRVDFLSMVGTDQMATDKAAWAATVKLVGGWFVCRDRERGAFSYYATGSGCKWPGAAPRADLSRNFESQIATALGQLTRKAATDLQ